MPDNGTAPVSGLYVPPDRSFLDCAWQDSAVLIHTVGFKHIWSLEERRKYELLN